MNNLFLADKFGKIAKDYEGLNQKKQGINFRGLFIIDGKGIMRQIKMNDLPLGCSVDET